MKKRYIRTDDAGNITAVAKRKRKAKHNRIILVVIAIIAILITSVSCIGSDAEQKQENEVIVYTRVIQEYEVGFGDSVSKIAAQFCPEFIDFEEYQKEFMRLNNCDSNIYAGDVMKVWIYEN